MQFKALMNIDEIGLELKNMVGYSNNNNFISSFKKCLENIIISIMPKMYRLFMMYQRLW